MNTRQSIIAIILMFVTLGLADGNPTAGQLKTALVLLVITIFYTITMTYKNTKRNEHDNNSYGNDGDKRND